MPRPHFPTPPATYDRTEEAGFRRLVADHIEDNEFEEIRIAGGVLYNDNGSLKFKSKNGTVTTVGAL